MANIRYQMSASKSYNYQGNVLVATPIAVTFGFTADVPDPEKAGIVPYYRTAGVSDNFFQNILRDGNLKFVSSSMEPSLGEGKDNQYCSWTEVYGKIEKESNLFDVQITMNVPAWRLNFVNFIDENYPSESRRLRQAYGYTPLSGTFSARTTNPINDWREVFLSYNQDDILVESASLTESWENGEVVYSVAISWKSYKLNSVPVFKERL